MPHPIPFAIAHIGAMQNGLSHPICPFGFALVLTAVVVVVVIAVVAGSAVVAFSVVVVGIVVLGGGLTNTPNHLLTRD